MGIYPDYQSGQSFVYFEYFEMQHGTVLVIHSTTNSARNFGFLPVLVPPDDSTVPGFHPP